MKNIFLSIFVCILSIGGLLSCGLEEYYYMDYIPEGDYRDVNSATIRLPASSRAGYGERSSGGYFSNFVIYYRIYISDIPFIGRIDETTRSSVNSTLNSDFNTLSSYTNITSTDVSTSNLETRFFNLKYYKLLLADRNIDTFLGRNSLNQTLTIHFPPNTGEEPTLVLGDRDPVIGDNAFILRRATDGPNIIFSPKPNSPEGLFRTFLNHPELYDKGNVNNENNADVATNTKNVEMRYTYVSMYIMAVGLTGETPPKTIYSQPAFLGTFMLAEAP